MTPVPTRRARMAPVALLLATLIGGCGQAGVEPAALTAPRAPDASAGAPAAPPPPPRLELANTAVHELIADGSGRRYPIWIDVPASYADDGGRRYPVVFVTDALYSFPLVRSIRNLLGQRGRNIEDFILVGLPPQHGLTSRDSRSRDYTPSNPLLDPRERGKSTYGAPLYGEAAAYRDFIHRQVFPLIERHYHADMGRKVFAGHSLGGLFGSYVLLTRPDMFESYILGSPSLWFHGRGIDGYEAAYAQKHEDLPARVMLYIGMYETYGPGPRYFDNVDMVGQMQAFERRLVARRYPGLSIGSEVIADEDHLSVFPATISRGLRWALPGKGAYTSG